MIICIGESLVDIIHDEAFPGGSLLNSAVAVSRLDGPAIYVGALSQDRYGKMIMDRLIENCVLFDPELSNRPESTMKAMVHIDENGGTSYDFEYKGSVATILTKEQILNSIAMLENTDFILFGSLGILIQSSIIEAVKDLSSQSFIMFDPNIRPSFIEDLDKYLELFYSMCRISDIVKLSNEDLSYLGLKADGLLQRCKGSLIITSKDGSTWYFKDRPALTSKSPEVEVVDTIGCGDTFSAALLVRLQEAHDGQKVGNQEILDFATRCASLNCQCQGACCPLRSQV